MIARISRPRELLVMLSEVNRTTDMTYSLSRESADRARPASFARCARQAAISALSSASGDEPAGDGCSEPRGVWRVMAYCPRILVDARQERELPR